MAQDLWLTQVNDVSITLDLRSLRLMRVDSKNASSAYSAILCQTVSIKTMIQWTYCDLLKRIKWFREAECILSTVRLVQLSIIEIITYDTKGLFWKYLHCTLTYSSYCVPTVNLRCSFCFTLVPLYFILTHCVCRAQVHWCRHLYTDRSGLCPHYRYHSKCGVIGQSKLWLPSTVLRHLVSLCVLPVCCSCFDVEQSVICVVHISAHLDLSQRCRFNHHVTVVTILIIFCELFAEHPVQ